jgi:hypothetical protein
VDLIGGGGQALRGVQVGDRGAQRRQPEGLEPGAGTGGKQRGDVDRHGRKVGDVGRIADGEVDAAGTVDERVDHPVRGDRAGTGVPDDDRAAALMGGDQAVGAQHVERRRDR